MKDSKKVLHVLWGLHAAGIENLALQLIKHSPKNSFKLWAKSKYILLN